MADPRNRWGRSRSVGVLARSIVQLVMRTTPHTSSWARSKPSYSLMPTTQRPTLNVAYMLTPRAVMVVAVDAIAHASDFTSPASWFMSRRVHIAIVTNSGIPTTVNAMSSARSDCPPVSVMLRPSARLINPVAPTALMTRSRNCVPYWKNRRIPCPRAMPSPRPPNTRHAIKATMPIVRASEIRFCIISTTLHIRIAAMAHR